MKYLFLLLIGFSLFLTACSSTGMAGGSWKLLGEQNVNLLIDKDVIELGNNQDEFRQIRLIAPDGPVNVQDMKIHFDNGSVQDVPLNAILKSGQQSRVIRLDGGLRRVDKIIFWYNTVGLFSGKSRIAVWASK
ncbi:MAG: hypothetical protein SH818_11090 [Saprospiraceae bacterium]|nr:hypothetical protein [Saprospiraceae bacterium]